MEGSEHATSEIEASPSAAALRSFMGRGAKRVQNESTPPRERGWMDAAIGIDAEF